MKIKIDSDALDNWNMQISQWREKHGLDHDLYLSKIKSSMIAPQVVVQELALIEERSASTHRQWLRALRRYHRELTQLFERIAPAD